MHSDDYWMEFALNEAQQAYLEDEIPVGAVLVKDDTLILKNHNRTRQNNNPLAHAESLILQEIQKTEKFLTDYTLYVTLEPCIMCSGTIILSKLKKLVFGTYDPKAGAVGSIYNVLLDKHFNHHPEIISGIKKNECSQILKDFFKSKRKNKKSSNTE
jgi:tRNA(adenine34) deaminase